MGESKLLNQKKGKFHWKPEGVFAEDTTKDASWPEDIWGAGGKPPQIMIEWQSSHQNSEIRCLIDTNDCIVKLSTGLGVQSRLLTLHNVFWADLFSLLFTAHHIMCHFPYSNASHC